AIEALVHLGEIERAERLTAELKASAQALGRVSAFVAAARCRALITSARGHVGPALQDLEQALGVHASVPMPIELARTLIVKGQLERRRKNRRASAASLRQALEICEQMGATLWVKRARDELDRLGRFGR